VGPRDAVLGGTATHLIQPFKNAILSRYLDQNMPKNAYFWKKSCKIAAASGARPQTPSFLSSLTAVAFVECICTSIEGTLLLRKITEVTHSNGTFTLSGFDDQETWLL